MVGLQIDIRFVTPFSRRVGLGCCHEVCQMVASIGCACPDGIQDRSATPVAVDCSRDGLAS